MNPRSISTRAALLPVEHAGDLRAELRGELVLPGDPSYDAARMVWNQVHDRYPAAIIRCREARDAAAGVRFARAHGLEIAVRGGGHSMPGYSTGDDVLVIDVSPMKATRVDRARRTIHAEAWLTLGELIRAMVPFGLGTTTGIVSDTGIARQRLRAAGAAQEPLRPDQRLPPQPEYPAIRVIRDLPRERVRPACVVGRTSFAARICHGANGEPDPREARIRPWVGRTH